jgi:NitT/TauT family transport system substrate-binding protein
MRQIRSSLWVVTTAAVLLAAPPKALAEDTLKVAVAQRGAWDSAAAELGQAAGIFKKRGIVLDLQYPDSGSELESPVISGDVDLGVAADVLNVLHAYTGGAPVRIIGANLTGSPSYWYVPATSPIKTLKDVAGKTIAYSTGRGSGRYDVFDLMDQYRVKARPVATAGGAATLSSVMSGQLAVGWATPPFGIDALEQGQIRVLARANSVSKIRDKTVRVMIANANVVQQRKDVLTRFMEAYRESVEWMYSDPAALKHYAEFAGVSEDVAQRLRNEFFTRDMLSPDKIIGLKAIAKDAIASSNLHAPLSSKQVSELIQIPAPPGKAGSRSIGAIFRALSPR